MYEAKVMFIRSSSAKSKFEMNLFARMSQSLEGNYLYEGPDMEAIYNRTICDINDLKAEPRFKYANELKVERTYNPDGVQVYTIAISTGEKTLLCHYAPVIEKVTTNNETEDMKKRKLDFGKYEYNSAGVCTNPDQVLAHSYIEISYLIELAQYNAGWLIGYYCYNNDAKVSILACEPSLSWGVFATKEIACIEAAERVLEFFEGVESEELKPLHEFYQSLTNKNTMATKKTGKEKAPTDPELAHTITVENIPLGQIFPSDSNPRKTFDKVYIAELADSMRPPIGLLQPITLREFSTDKNGKTYEIAFGECRYRAAKLLGWETIPSIIKNIGDDDLLAMQVIENLQREDVNPIDEAVAFKTLLKTESIEWLCNKIHKTKKYVVDRLKLNELIEEAIEKVRAGVLPIGHAVVISKLSFADQKTCLRECIGSGFGENTDDDYCKLPLEDLKDLIAEKIMTDFDKVNFDPADAALYDEAGPCTECPKRTCNNNLLFHDITRDDKCTDAACFQQKITNHVAREKERAKEKYGTVLSGEKDFNTGYVKVQGVSVKYSETPTKNATPVVLTKAERYNRNTLGTTVYVDSKVLEASKVQKVEQKEQKKSSGGSLSWKEMIIKEHEEAWPSLQAIKDQLTPKGVIIQEYFREELESVQDHTFLAYAAINSLPGMEDITNAKEVCEFYESQEWEERYAFKKQIIDYIIENYQQQEIIMLIMLLKKVMKQDEEIDEDDESYGFTWKQMMDIINPPKQTAAKKSAAAAKKTPLEKGIKNLIKK